MPYSSVAGFHSASIDICLPWSAADQPFHILVLCSLLKSAALSPFSHARATRLHKLNWNLDKGMKKEEINCPIPLYKSFKSYATLRWLRLHSFP